MKPTKYVVTLTVETLTKVTKKNLKKFIEEQLSVNDESTDWFPHMDKVRVRTVDFD